jgi:unsaturated rhamnogalacturonyl hydrolase
MLTLSLSAIPALAQSNHDLDTWQAGDGPAEMGLGVARHFVTSPHQYGETIHYSEVVTWYGALTFADATHDVKLRNDLIQRFEPLMPGGKEAGRIPLRRHVDDSVFGVVPLEIARQTHDERYLKIGLAWADRQWEQPRPDGLSGETRFWIDDMYMITLLQVEAYRASHDPKYLDRAALEMSVYLGKLQQPNGLFFHAQDVPIFWGRGNGWVAAGMAELLSELPRDHPQYATILRSYRLMMSSLLMYQEKDGAWRQLLDHEEAWPESSATGMFTFAMIQGVRHGWLNADVYGPVARRSWMALVGYVDQNNDVTNVCEGTDKKNDVEYYLARKRRTGDFHGQAPFLWSATAALR